MKTIEETRRELFEKTFADEANLDTVDGRPGVYEENYVRCYWRAFNAALDAVVIELPSPRNGSLEMHGRCVDAITSTNLGLTVK